MTYGGGLLRNSTIIPSTQMQSGNQVTVIPDPGFASGASGLPNPIGGIITLEDRTVYNIVGDVDIGVNRIVMGEGTKITSSGFGTTSLTNNVPGQPILTLSKEAEISGLTIFPGNATSTFINAQAVGVQPYLIIEGCKITGFQNLGNISNYETILISDCVFDLNTNAFILGSQIGNFLFDRSSVRLSSGQSFLNVGSTAQVNNTVTFKYSFVGDGVGSTAITVDPGAIIPTEGFRIIGCQFSALGIQVDGITTGDQQAYYRSNINFRDTYATCAYKFFSGATTLLPSLNTWVKAAGTTTVLAEERIRHISDNRASYSGEKPIMAQIIATISGSGSSLSNYEFTFGINGNPDVNYAQAQQSGTSGSIDNLVIIGNMIMNNGDYAEVFIRRTSAGSGFIINSCVVKINEIR